MTKDHSPQGHREKAKERKRKVFLVFLGVPVVNGFVFLGNTESVVIPASAGIQFLDFPGFPPARE
jgi:hypothetical protein